MINRRIHQVVIWFILITSIVSATSIASFWQVSAFQIKYELKNNAPSSGAITGKVFKDYNSNGVYNTDGDSTNPAIDVGISSVTVTAFDSAGANRGSVTTDANGNYSLSATGTGPYRIEFTNLPSGFMPSARSTDSVGTNLANQSGSTVHFVDDGNTDNVNLAGNIPNDYCQNNPNLCMSQIYNGDNNISFQSGAIWKVPYSTSNGTNNNQTAVGYNENIGATWGLAYDKSQKKVYSSAFLAVHAGLESGLGAIYVSDPATIASSLFINLAAAPYNVPVGTIGDNATRGLASPSSTNIDSSAFPLVGKVGLGDLDISDDGSNLYVVNLFDQKLYTIVKDSDNNPVTPPTAGDVIGTPIPNPSCVGGEWRPFAIGKTKGKLYVGGICDAQTSQNANDLKAAIYEYSGMAFVPVLEYPLNYLKGMPYASGTCNNNAYRGFFPWLDTAPPVCRVFSGINYINYPQPILSDIEFDNDGSMIMAFADRINYQIGETNSTLSLVGTTRTNAHGGDILRAYNNNGVFELESNGIVGGLTGQTGNSQGIGGGEFYNDSFLASQELTEGSLAFFPGSSSVVAAYSNPNELNLVGGQGFSWLSNVNGAKSKGYTVTTWGLHQMSGDSEILCDVAPIEIGNRVWYDQNRNGVQDPNEQPFAGVTVNLYTSTYGYVATTITNTQGEYYFSSASGASTASEMYNLNLANNTNYVIRLDNPIDYQDGGPLFGYQLTTANVTEQLGFDDGSDSDAIMNTIPGNFGSGGGIVTAPAVIFNAGNAGENNHTYDFGFMLTPTSAPASISGRVMTAGGRGIANAIVQVDGGNLSQPIITRTNAFGYYRFNELESEHIYVVSARSKRFSFRNQLQTINLTEDITGINFVTNNK